MQHAAHIAKEFVTKQSQQPTSSTDKTTNTKPITKKLSSILEKQSSSIAKTFLQSQKIISVLDKNVNKILKQNNVSYVSVENGQIIAQPIQNKEINKAITNIQKVINSYINTVDHYARMVYNTDSINSIKQLKPGQNLSLYHVIKFLDIKIKIRKARDLTTAANAAAQVPVPNITLAAEYTERATQYTAAELNQLEDANSSYELITTVRKKIEFYGEKYDKSKSQLLDLKSTLDAFQSLILNKALTEVNTQINKGINQITGSINN